MELLGSQPSVLKELNRTLVMRLVWQQGPLSRADLARLSGLSVPAILKIVEGLMEDGFLYEIGEGESSGGRRPILLSINPDGAYAIGVELTPVKIGAAVVNLEFSIVNMAEDTIDPESGYEKILKQMTRLIGHVIKISGVNKQHILGIGISHPGIMGEDADKILLATNLKSWKEVPLGQDIEKRFNLPTSLEVDARAFAQAEMWLGHARNVKNFISIDIDIGLGAGMVLDGKIYRGSRGIAGELGHIVTEPDGFPCSCGKRGCLETVVAFPAICREVKKNPSSMIKEFCQNRMDRLNIDVIIQAAQLNDPVALGAIEHSARTLGKALGNLMNFVDIDTVFINSKLTSLGEKFFRPLHEEIQKYFLLAQEKPVKVLPSALGQYCELLSAAILILRNIFESK